MTEQQEKDLQAALVECRRFVSAAKLALEKHKEEAEYKRSVEKCENEGYGIGTTTFDWPRGIAASSASAKRASMDLSRALSAFRRRESRESKKGEPR